MENQSLREKADVIGITGSVLCIIHCLVSPFLVMGGKMAGLSDTWHFLDFIFVGINIFAVFHATKHHSTPAIRVALWSFLVIFSIAILFEDQSPAFVYLGYFASLGLVLSHVVNLRHCRKCLSGAHRH
jgi:hypothetical protein